MSDRVFIVSFSVSVALHLLLLCSQLLPMNWLNAPTTRAPLDIIYEYHKAQQELRHLQAQLSRATREAGAAPAAPGIAERPVIRIPDRPILADDHALSDVTPIRSSVVDLANLVDAARGDPILLSYFSAIREQIQQAANRRTWLTGQTAQGLVYVSFLLTSSGTVRGVEVLADRSVPSQALQDTALRIVNSAAPFPPFPPSMTELSKTVVVPLEFLLGSG